MPERKREKMVYVSKDLIAIEDEEFIEKVTRQSTRRGRGAAERPS